MATAGKNERLSNRTASSRGGAVCAGYGAPRRGGTAGGGRATARAGTGRVKVVYEFRNGRERWDVVEEVEVWVLEPSAEGARHPPETFIMVHFREHVGNDHSQPRPEDDYGHPRKVSGKEDVGEHAEGEGDVGVEGGGGLSCEMVEDDSLPEADEDSIDAETVVLGCGVDEEA